MKLSNVLVSAILLAACARPVYQNKVVAASRSNTELTSCPLSFPKAGLCADYDWVTTATEQTAGSMILRFWKSGDRADHRTQASPTPHALDVVVWMPSMGHGSSPTHVTSLGGGSYRIDNIFFIMHGDWELRFQLKDQNAVFDQAVDAIQF